MGGSSWARWFVLVVSLVVGGGGLNACTGGGSSGHNGADGGPTGDSPEIVACGRGEACPEGTYCDPYHGCSECVFDQHCGDGKKCTARKCVDAVECPLGNGCPSTEPVCDVSSGRCVQCLVDGDCPKGNHCTDRECKPFQACINSFDCKNGKVCSRETGECVECVTAGDCQTGQLCARGSCVRACDGDSDCRDLNQLCDLKEGHCAACVSTVDCPDSYHCAEGKCRLNACVAGSARCGDLQTMVACQPDGSGVASSPCMAKSSCVEESGKASCKPWVCVPNGTACDPTHAKVEQCSADGLSVLSSRACPSGQFCVGDSCRDATCQPGMKLCDGTNIVLCNAAGNGVETTTPCAQGLTCDPVTVTCVPSICTPGEKACQDGVPATCKADGMAFEPGAPCDSNNVCSSGLCLPKVCEPETTRCKYTDIYQCNIDGTSDSFVSSCYWPTLCDDTSGTAECKNGTCTAGTAICDGNVATTCNEVGTGPVAGGTDCTKSNQACSGGACKDVVCSGTSYCKDGNVYSCTNNGTTTSLYDTCGTTEYCAVNGDTATCTPQKCTPNALGCNGDVVANCNADGSGFLTGGTDCTKTKSACVNATCLPVICTAGSTFCQDGSVYSCGTKGVSSSLYSTCSANYFCSASGSSASCQYDVCTAGSPICRGNFATTCATDGSGPLPTGGTDCALTSKACDAGQCKPIVCDKGETFCSGGNVALCNATGTGSTTSTSCVTGQFCSDSGTSASCAYDICTPNAATCYGEKLATCDATGGSYATTGTNCAATSKVCNEAAACAANAVDTIATNGALSSSGSAGGYLNKIAPRTSRSLTQIEQYFAITGTSILTWVVYEGDSTSNTFTKIFEKTTSGTGTGFQSSGTIDVSLQAGKRYLIGVMVSGTFSYRWDPSAFNQNTSFGQVTASLVASGTTPQATMSVAWLDYYNYYNYPYYQRLTTTLP